MPARENVTEDGGHKKQLNSLMLGLPNKKQLKTMKLGLPAEEKEGGHKKQLNYLKVGLSGGENKQEEGEYRHRAKKQLNRVNL